MAAKDDQIKEIVHRNVDQFSCRFRERHMGEREDPNGCINMKIHNAFIEALGPTIQYYAALVRSLDSSLGNMLEAMAIDIAKLSFEVRRYVVGNLYEAQTQHIATLLESYKARRRKPSIEDYQELRGMRGSGKENEKRHDSDYYLISKADNKHYLIELKIGGDLDNKKARSEKEAILEQFAILSNTLEAGTQINVYFATAYNRFGEGKPWTQERVRQFFAEDELLIGREFWNFICQDDGGYDLVMGTYREKSDLIRNSLRDIQIAYLGE